MPTMVDDDDGRGERGDIAVVWKGATDALGWLCFKEEEEDEVFFAGVDEVGRPASSLRRRRRMRGMLYVAHNTVL